MTTFDFETAWAELALPMFQTLPQDVRDLYARVIVESGELSQSKNLNMPWPVWEETAANGAIDVNTFRSGVPLRACFDAIPAETLAIAARVIHNYGHWWAPSKAKALTGHMHNPDRVGGHWKFSNYADQSLAARIHETLDPRWPNGRGISFRIMEGFIRVQCSTPDSWTWEEIGLGTLTNWEHIRVLESNRPQLLELSAKTRRDSWDAFAERAREYMGLLKVALRPSGRVAEFLDLERYMIDETEIKARHARETAADPTRLERARARVIERFESTTRKAAIERDGLLWLIDHGIDTDNAIYYDHTGKWSFGWREPFAGEALSKLLDVVSEFPYEYDIKRAKGEN